MYEDYCKFATEGLEIRKKYYKKMSEVWEEMARDVAVARATRRRAAPATDQAERMPDVISCCLEGNAPRKATRLHALNSPKKKSAVPSKKRKWNMGH
jgi:hypothetical protein